MSLFDMSDNFFIILACMTLCDSRVPVNTQSKVEGLQKFDNSLSTFYHTLFWRAITRVNKDDD